MAKTSTVLPKLLWVVIVLHFSTETKCSLCSDWLDRTTGGLYRSDDVWKFWTKMSDEVSGGTDHTIIRNYMQVLTVLIEFINVFTVQAEDEENLQNHESR